MNDSEHEASCKFPRGRPVAAKLSKIGTPHDEHSAGADRSAAELVNSMLEKGWLSVSGGLPGHFDHPAIGSVDSTAKVERRGPARISCGRSRRSARSTTDSTRRRACRRRCRSALPMRGRRRDQTPSSAGADGASVRAPDRHYPCPPTFPGHADAPCSSSSSSALAAQSQYRPPRRLASCIAWSRQHL